MQAQRIVDACKYPPVGRRSAAFTTRAGGYSFFGGPAQIKRVNDGIAIILMIETVEAYRNVDAITGVQGIDALFIGLSDLAISMGHPGDNHHPQVREAVDTIVGRCVRGGLGCGLLAGNAADFHRYSEMGAKYLPMTITSLVAGALREAIAVRKSGR